MDITLERILSLLPHKDDGKFVRGSKKEFAQSIGYDSGDIVSMWLNGSSTSYNGKLHEIASKYNVSVEWLEGKTDKKEPAATVPHGDRPDKDTILLEWFHSLPEEKRQAILALGDAPKELF